VPVADDGTLPSDLAELITNLFDTMDAAYGGLGSQSDRGSQAVFVYNCAEDRGKTARRRGAIVNPVLDLRGARDDAGSGG
jgi:peptide deformylase